MVPITPKGMIRSEEKRLRASHPVSFREPLVAEKDLLNLNLKRFHLRSTRTFIMFLLILPIQTRQQHNIFVCWLRL